MWRETKILLIDDDSVRRRDLAVVLNFLGEDNLSCSSQDWQQVVESLSSSREVLCVLIGAVNAPASLSGLLKTVAAWDEFLPVLLLGEISSVDLPEELRRRVLSSLEMPPSYSKLLDSLHRAQVYREMYDAARERGRQREPNLFRSLVGTSRAIQHVRQMMQQVADTDASVLILGESGTGKEVVARNLHYHSKRREAPFVPVNCGAIPAELLESELFGHEKGAFTGAITSRAGRFELANGGTLFLDEIGEIPLHVQAKLLKFLEDGSIQSVGSPLSKTVQVQVIAATNKDLRRLVESGEFRADLYYRLAVLPVEIPPLRQHLEDLPVLMDILLMRINRDRQPTLRLSGGCRQRLLSYDYPGNIRELVNIFERLAVLADDEASEQHLPPELLGLIAPISIRPTTPRQETDTELPADDELGESLKAQVQRYERQLILQAVQSQGSKRKAAQQLGIDIGTLIRKLQRD